MAKWVQEDVETSHNLLNNKMFIMYNNVHMLV
jgi:hypothetical protein